MGRGYYGYGGYYGGYPYGRYGYGYYKREAEADAEPQFLAPYAPFAYAYAPHYYAVPAASSFQHVDTPAATYGISQIHKREAEAEPEAEAAADAYYGYYGRGYGYHGLGYYGYGAGYYGNYGYARYGYPAYAYGRVYKREAEAEPEAEAAADAYYGYYGHAASYVHRSPQGLKGYYGPPTLTDTDVTTDVSVTLTCIKLRAIHPPPPIGLKIDVITRVLDSLPTRRQ